MFGISLLFRALWASRVFNPIVLTFGVYHMSLILLIEKLAPLSTLFGATNFSAVLNPPNYTLNLIFKILQLILRHRDNFVPLIKRDPVSLLIIINLLKHLFELLGVNNKLRPPFIDPLADAPPLLPILALQLVYLLLLL